MHNEQALKAGGTLAQAVVLLNLNPNKGTPSTSLGPKMGLESTSLGRTLKSMENNGLISRVPNKEDKRGVFNLKLDLSKFPYDTQNIGIQLSSTPTMYTSHRMDDNNC